MQDMVSPLLHIRIQLLAQYIMEIYSFCEETFFAVEIYSLLYFY